ncbi:MAG: RNA polymerase sigma factor [Cellulosilyticum sp.]|nr:RNA polymerase sigma factor [Cellulosilyticum sp.]
MNKKITKVEAQRLYEENIAYIYKASLFLTRSKILAEDISQEVFVKAFEKYGTFDQTRSIRPWLYQIMLNLIRSQYKKKKDYIGIDDICEMLSDDYSLVECEVVKNEEDKELWEGINKLSLKLKEVIILHFYLDMKLEEVAKILKIPVGTCKSRLNAALNKLRNDKGVQEITYLLGGRSI